MASRTPVLTLLIAVLAALGVACSGDPVAADAAAYQDAMAPALATNVELAQEFLEVAAQVKKGDVDADAIHRRWKGSVLPLADDLHEQAQAIHPATPELAGLHAQLVDAWGDRAEAYRSMHSSYAKADADSFQDAFDKNVEAKLAEEDYFNKVNRLLEPYGYHLDQFP
ncbi:MAG: hypothetical protein GY913_21175 [Proteobacteria bacterium]|nr:hypothetical protein [Pseudomonadota bacterium]MCP4919420.1 hypothetical protein [Pseudomonadota bacterium]